MIMMQHEKLRTVTGLMLVFLCQVALWGQPAQRMIGMGEESDSVTFQSILDLGLMVLDMTTVDGEWPTCDYVESPEGAMGRSITNVTKVPGRLLLWNNGAVAYDSGDYVPNLHGATIRIRGNTSAYYVKKPYKINLQEKGDLLLRNNPSVRDKEWILIRDPFYKTLQGLEVNRLLGMSWTPAYRYVNLVLNNDYQGVYMLLESVKRNNNCRVKVDKQGYFFERDAYWWNGKVGIASQLYTMMQYTFKYPKEEDLTDDDMNYMTQLITDFENSLSTDTYDQVIDVESFAAWCLGHDILATFDAGGTNQFFVKNDRTSSSLITIPLMWDFDSTEGDSVSWSRCHKVLYPGLFISKNKAFLNAFVNKWRQVGPTFEDDVTSAIRDFQYGSDGMGLLKSVPLDNQRWGSIRLAWAYLNQRVQWFHNRLPWLRQAIDELVPKGDVNGDFYVDIVDVNMVMNMILDMKPDDPVADVTGDGKIDVDDLNAIIGYILSGGNVTTDDDLYLMPSNVTFDADGGGVSLMLHASGNWQFDVDDIPEWLTVTPTSGEAGNRNISVRATATQHDREAWLRVRCGNAIDSIKVTQEGPMAVQATCAQVLNGTEGVLYRVSGRVSSIANVERGYWCMDDDTGSISIFGVLDERGKPCSMDYWGIMVGDTITVQGVMNYVRNEAALVNVSVLSIERTSNPDNSPAR